MLIFWSSSRYALQSFVTNTGTKEFPLLSGLGGHHRSCAVIESKEANRFNF